MVTLVTSNQQALGHEEEGKRVLHNLQRIEKASSGQNYVIGLQEMYPPAFMTALDFFTKDHTGEHGKPGQRRVQGGSPLAWGEDWELGAHGTHDFYDGEEHISLTRYISWAVLTKGNKSFLATNRQYPAQGWNPSGNDAPRKDMSAAEYRKRHDLWVSANKVDLEFISKIVTRHGEIASVHFADANRMGHKDIWGVKLNGRQIRYYSRGLDYIGLVNGRDFKWDINRPLTRLRVESDHAALMLDAELVRV